MSEPSQEPAEGVVLGVSFKKIGNAIAEPLNSAASVFNQWVVSPLTTPKGPNGPPEDVQRVTFDFFSIGDSKGKDYYEALLEAQKKNADKNFLSRIGSVKAVVPPPEIQEFLKMRGDLDVNFDDPEIQEAFKRTENLQKP